MLSACAAPSHRAKLIVSSKRIADPLKSVAVDEHAVKAAVAFRFARQIVPRGEDDALALDRGDARSGVAEIAPAAQPDLDEDQRPAIPADQVDLAAAHPEIALDDALTATLQVTRRPFLGFAAARRGGIVGLCLHACIDDGRIRRIVCRPDPAREPRGSDPPRPGRQAIAPGRYLRAI